MTKFGRFGKTGPSGFLFQSIRFWQVQRRIKIGAKLKYLKIRCVFRLGKRLRGAMEPRWKNSKPRANGRKNWTAWFWILKYSVFPEQIDSD
jgi:hypothetical protein